MFVGRVGAGVSWFYMHLCFYPVLLFSFFLEDVDVLIFDLLFGVVTMIESR